MDKEEEEEEEDNDDDDDVIFTIANFFQKFCPFFGEIFCTVEKSHVFFTQNIAEKYSMQKLPQKFPKKFKKK